MEPDLRLVNSSGLPSNDSGLVEICTGGKWSRVCHSHWDRKDALVICNQLGMPSSSNSYSNRVMEVKLNLSLYQIL